MMVEKKKAPPAPVPEYLTDAQGNRWRTCDLIAQCNKNVKRYKVGSFKHRALSQFSIEEMLHIVRLPLSEARLYFKDTHPQTVVNRRLVFRKHLESLNLI